MSIELLSGMDIGFIGFCTLWFYPTITVPHRLSAVLGGLGISLVSLPHPRKQPIGCIAKYYLDFFCFFFFENL